MKTLNDILISMLTALAMILLYYTMPFLTLLPLLVLCWALSGDEYTAYRRGQIAALKDMNSRLDKHIRDSEVHPD